MSGISTHVLDTARGRPAAGVAVVLEVAGPDGAYYVVTDISRLGGTDDVEFVRNLVTQIGVAGVPGSSFYAPKELGRTKVRFMWAKRDETLHEAGRRLLRVRELIGTNSGRQLPR